MRIPVALAAVAALAAAVAAPGAPTAAAKRLTVITTTTDLKALALAVGGDHVTVTSIATGLEDPHFIQAKPSYMMLARKADLWIRVGMGLEIGYERLILDGSRNQRIREGARGHLDASAGVLRLDVPETRVTRELGDVHPQGNPHYWLDPLNARIMAKTIADRLGELAPDRKADFQRHLQRFQAALDERMFGAEAVKAAGGTALWEHLLRGDLETFLKDRGPESRLRGWLGALRPVRGARVVTFHRSWVYLTNRFGLEIAAELEPKPGVPPSPAHLAEVIERVKGVGAKVILVEPFHSRKAADLVAERTGAEVLVLPNAVGGSPEATDYLALLDLLVKRLAEALKAGAPAGPGGAGGTTGPLAVAPRAAS